MPDPQANYQSISDKLVTYDAIFAVLDEIVQCFYEAVDRLVTLFVKSGTLKYQVAFGNKVVGKFSFYCIKVFKLGGSEIPAVDDGFRLRSHGIQ